MEVRATSRVPARSSSGTFCMGDCVNGVNVTVDGVKHSVSPETVDEFFEKEVLAKVQ